MRELSGKSEARGRNGWFAPREFEVFLALSEKDPEQPIVFNVYSKQRGNSAPITLWLTVEDALSVVAELALAVTAADPKAEVRSV